MNLFRNNRVVTLRTATLLPASLPRTISGGCRYAVRGVHEIRQAISMWNNEETRLPVLTEQQRGRERERKRDAGPASKRCYLWTLRFHEFRFVWSKEIGINEQVFLVPGGLIVIY